ncbi:MAG: helix-turn-helix transcriptional regulator [Clostridia bacterium]|nr:helix-turn-helix transcriptional regulator [Clostridia bacterium]
MISKKTFGSFIKEKRQEKNLTQKELAELLFLSESAVSKWEMGKSYPDITMIPDLCRVLDVSEKELISGASDTEYRKMKHDARLYKKISETFFWGFTAAYAAAFVICLICDLAINKAVTFSLIVFASLLTAFSFVPTFTRFSQKHKLAVFAGSTYFSIVFLVFIVGLKSEAVRALTVAAGVLLGYAAIFGMILLNKYMPQKLKKFNLLLYFSGILVCVFILLLMCGVKINLKVTAIVLYSFIPFLTIALAHIFIKNKLYRISVDVLIFGVVGYFAQRVTCLIFGGDASQYYTADLLTWNENTINGNISLLVLAVCTAAAIVFAAVGIKKSSSHK